MEESTHTWDFIIPNPLATKTAVNVINLEPGENIIDWDNFGSFHRRKKIFSIVFSFINKLKLRLIGRNSVKYGHLNSNLPIHSTDLASNFLIRSSQRKCYPEIVDFLSGKTSKLPALVSQLNLFRDKLGIIRTNCKLKKLKAEFNQRCPVLLSRSCSLARAVVCDAHCQLLHGGIYKVLDLVRKEFWIPQCYTLVRKVLYKCVICKRLHGRAVKVNANDFKDYRVNPESVPFRQLILDYIGPFNVKNTIGNERKIYILIFSCFWSRAVNLVVCDNLDTGTFLRALQLQIYDYGVPSLICSDNGTQIVQGLKIFDKLFDDVTVLNFLKERNIGKFMFQPYPAGSSHLGGSVESLVKQVKNLLRGSYGRAVLSIRDFEFLVKKVNMLVNKRPIAFKGSLSSDDIDESLKRCLTPELLIKGYEVPSISILPPIRDYDDPDFILNQDEDQVWKNTFRSFKSLNGVRDRLRRVYLPEFIYNLQQLASQDSKKFVPHSHFELKVGDLVSIKENLTKPFNFPLGIVTEIEINSAGEVNTATVRKANKEIIRRHVENLIFISREEKELNKSSDSIGAVKDKSSEIVISSRPSRAAALKCIERNRNLLAK